MSKPEMKRYIGPADSWGALGASAYGAEEAPAASIACRRASTLEPDLHRS
jgi:hypothetical protein